MSEEEGGGAAETTDDSTPAEESSEQIRDPEAHAKSAEAAKHRIAKKKADTRAAKAEAAAAAAKERLAAVLKAAGLEDDGSGSADQEAVSKLAKVEQREAAARNRLLEAEFKNEALDAGVRPDRVKQAARLADFDSVEIDDETGEIAGMQDVVSSVLEDMPELKAAKHSNPKVDNGTPGSPKRPRIDYNDVKSGDVSSMSVEEYESMMSEGVDIPIGTKGLKLKFRSQDPTTSVIQQAREAQKRRFKDRFGSS